MDVSIQQSDVWRAIAASVRGASHRRSSLPCQDVLLYRALPNAALIAALADGAGSASLAEVGAATAARSALDSLTGQVSSATGSPSATSQRDMVLNALQQAREAVLTEATKRDVRPRELASTLIAAVFGPTEVVAGQIGDGAVVIETEPESYKLLTRPPQSEHLNETVFLTADNALDQAQIAFRAGPVRRAAMLCDGLQLLALKYPELMPHHGFFAPLFRFLETSADAADAAAKLETFLQSPRITERTDDDLSLLLAALPRPVDKHHPTCRVTSSAIAPAPPRTEAKP